MDFKKVMDEAAKSNYSKDKYIDENEFKRIIKRRDMEKKAYRYLNLELNILYSLINLLEEKGILDEEELDEKLLELDPETYERVLKRKKLFNLKKEKRKSLNKLSKDKSKDDLDSDSDDGKHDED
ncbi:MAG: hypothetical protein ACOCP4_02985 [Candidatus Woesearchaeota archaeon]